MVTKYTYNITILEHCQFRQCPKFVIYQQFYRQLKKLTCLETHQKCSECALQNRCIYYRYSGENFQKYPAIIVHRELIEKQRFDFGDLIQIEFVALTPPAFLGYIESFFDQLNMLMGINVRTKMISKLVLDENLMMNKKLKVKTPLIDLNVLEQSLYYEKYYNCKLVIGNGRWTCDQRTLTDRRIYRLDNHKTFIFGEIGDVEFDLIDMRWLDIGLGHTSFIGGGKLDEN